MGDLEFLYGLNGVMEENMMRTLTVWNEFTRRSAIEKYLYLSRFRDKGILFRCLAGWLDPCKREYIEGIQEGGKWKGMKII